MRLLTHSNIRPEMLLCSARLGQAQPASPRVTRQPASPGQESGVGGSYALRKSGRMCSALGQYQRVDTVEYLFISACADRAASATATAAVTADQR
jgi:hypothetical protein